MVEYYGPSALAVEELNEFFGFPATGKEQDWEIEFANPERLQEFIDVLFRRQFQGDQQDALAALVIATLDEACTENKANQDQKKMLKTFFRENEILRQKMQCLYFCFGRSPINENVIGSILNP